MDVRDEYIKTVNSLIDKFEFLRSSGVYFIPAGASDAQGKPRELQISGNPASRLVLLCDDDASPESATGKLLTDILNAMKFGPNEVFVISGVNAASSGPNPAAITALVETGLSRLTAVPNAVIAFGKTSSSVLTGMTLGKAAKVLQAPSLEDMLGNKDLKRKAWADLQAVMKEFGKDTV